MRVDISFPVTCNAINTYKEAIVITEYLISWGDHLHNIRVKHAVALESTVGGNKLINKQILGRFSR